MFYIYESDIPFVSIGDEIRFTISLFPGKEFHKTITYIDPVIDPVKKDYNDKNQNRKL